MPINSSNPRLPDFIQQRVDAFWSERFERDWGGRHILHGRPQRKGDLLLNHNDYLNLGGHPKIRGAQIEALQVHNEGTLMSAVFQHDDTPQLRLEQEFAEFLQAKECIITQSGYAANVGLLQTIAGPDVPVYIDMLAHMSLWEGINAARADARPFRHNDPEHLARKLKAYGPGIVVVDSVYSTDGSVAPLTDIVEVAECYGGVVVVDESHSLGTHGPQGAGMVVEAGLQDRVAFRTASLAKAFASRGGVIATANEFRTYFFMNSYSAIFSSALLDYEIAGLSITLELIRNAAYQRKKLRDVSSVFRQKMSDVGYSLESASQIVSPEPGSEIRTREYADLMEHAGVMGAIFCPPATPRKRACLRLSLHCGLTKEDVIYVAQVCERLYQECDAMHW